MNSPRTFRKKNAEAGVALLIAIFTLMLVSVVAISLIVASGTESALAGNYRSSTRAYYAGAAGLEEARGRMLVKNPNYFNNTIANFIPTGVIPQLAVGQARYIINPANGEVVAPTNLASPNTYPDREYQNEFGVPVAAAAILQPIPSVSPVAGLPGPPFKWVRINPITEASINRDVNGDGVLDAVDPLYFDSTHTDPNGKTRPSLIVPNIANPATVPLTAGQAFEITSLAVLSNGSERLEQYIVAPVTFGLNFNSALTLAGQNVNFQGATSNPYQMNGTDGSGNPPPVAGCNPNPANKLYAIGVTDPPGSQQNVNEVINGIPQNRQNNYTGAGGTPSVSNILLNSNMQTPASLTQLVQTITQSADVVISGNATQDNMPAAMSPTNPMTVVVDGNFSMTGNYTGYGLLIVTGNFAYSGTTGWKGIVLVIGDGTTTFLGQGGGNNEFDGTVFVATTKDAEGNLLPALGNVTYDINGGGGNGIFYNSCWVKNAQQPPTYRVLSFREIPYND